MIHLESNHVFPWNIFPFFYSTALFKFIIFTCRFAF